MHQEPESRPRPPFRDQGISPPGLEKEMDPKPQYEAAEYRAAGKLEGKVALVTGGDSGIGRSVAVLYAREGAKLALVYLEEEQPDAEKTRDEVEEAGSEALLIPGDVRDPGFCEQAVEQTIETFGQLDILVNNAAYQKHQDGIGDISLEQWSRTFRTNIDGYFHMVRAALPHLYPGAAIVNTGSITGLEGSAHLLDYSATKGAIHAFTKSLAQNLVERGIRVNCVAPGPVWTPLNPAELEPGEISDFGASTPMKRPAQPEEIAPAYVFFASEADSSYVTGNILPILGGDTVAG
jgi:NAD(P)-dependent dehydrogenase (short-subunit alcohol dehydrogenase family)